MMNSDLGLEWPAPAKLNLFLHITGRRGDGYHLLQTVFQLLDHGDSLVFRHRTDGLVRRVGEIAGVASEQDLSVQAANLLKASADLEAGVDIHLTKRIPIGAGLGGGSSDAATTLVALNNIWDLGYSTQQLLELGLQLGADVPVFVQGYSAWAEGVGEALTSIEMDEPWYLVITPPCQVSTAKVFSDPDLTRDCPPLTITKFLSGHGVNVCESVVLGRYPEVAKALDWLSGFAPATMSGTGSSVFARFDDKDAAEHAHTQLPTGWQGFVAKGLNRSPLLDVLK